MKPEKQHKPKQIRRVKVTEITEKGFRVRVLGKDYYLSRERYNYFLDATDEEIRDVVCYWEHYLEWKALDVSFTFKHLDNPDKYKHLTVTYVRGVPRPDLSIHIPKRKMMQIIRDYYNDDAELKKAYLCFSGGLNERKKTNQ